MQQSSTPREKKPRGFAAMDPEKQRQIASKGGKIAHERGHAHEFTPEEAREAGRKGGQTVSRDRKHMSEIGRLGGEARSQSRSEGAQPS
jgi:general stress protein YciG